MIPTDVAEIATLICDYWSELDDDDPTFKEIIKAAYRVYNAGYRRIPQESE
jgi:hypothetical protein